MKPITFTQFLLPHGKRVSKIIDRPDTIADQAAELVAAGCRLEIEVLRTGEVSMAVEYGDETLAIEIVPNGPKVPPAVDRIIAYAHRELKLRSDVGSGQPFPAG
jgi:hypothetical protein